MPTRYCLTPCSQGPAEMTGAGGNDRSGRLRLSECGLGACETVWAGVQTGTLESFCGASQDVLPRLSKPVTKSVIELRQATKHLHCFANGVTSPRLLSLRH